MPLVLRLKLGRGTGDGGQEKLSESPQGTAGTLAPRVAVTYSEFIVLFVCFPFFPGDTPPPKGRALVLSAEGAPRGPPVKRGWGSEAKAALLRPGSLPRAQLHSVPRHFQNPGTCMPRPSSLAPLSAWSLGPSWTGQPGSGREPGWGAVPWLRGVRQAERPLPTLPPFANGKARWRQGIPSLPCSCLRSRALWEL